MAEHTRGQAAALQLPGARFLIVEARYYENVGAMLHEGARAAIEAAGASVETVAVPGARALMEMSVARKLALGNGILTVDTLAQAEQRADPRHGDKGGDAARAALALAALKRSLGAL